MERRILILLFSLLFPLTLIGQQSSVYTLQESMRPGINPAYVGNSEISDLILLSRQQWLGFEGAPKGYFISSNVPLPNPNTGVGLDLQINTTEPYSQTGLFAAYSYSISFSDASKLSMGIRGGLNVYQVKIDQLSSIDVGDPLLSYPGTAILKPNFGAGLHYSFSNYFLDLSIPMLLRNELIPGTQEKQGLENRTSRNYFIMMGANISITDELILRQSVSAWYAKYTPTLIDLRMSALFDNKIELGVAYRISGGLAAYFQILAINDLKIGYAYELPLSYNYQLSSGTHEISFCIDFQFLNNKTTSPRRF